MNKNRIIEELNISICLGNIIIVFDFDNLDYLHLLCKRLVLRNITNVEIMQTLEERPSSKISKYVPQEVVEEIKKIYRMYDFSNKILVLSDPEQYGSLFDYVRNGILTKQELVDALLYKM